MRASMATAAVARELWPKERMVAMCLSLGGLKGSWVVARRRARWRESFLGLERRAALLWEALSLIRPTISLTFVMCPIESSEPKGEEGACAFPSSIGGS